MKTTGIIGGLSPQSTMKYYQWLNEGVEQRLGKYHSARILLSSVDFGEFVALKNKDDWETQARILVEQAQALERCGADFIILATNTMHKMAEQIENALKIPFLHLAEATADRIKELNLKTIGLLGTRYTMEMDFYKKRLVRKGLNVLIPEKQEREIINNIIYEELCYGVIKSTSRSKFKEIIKGLEEKGAQGVILGCTEITLLVGQRDSSIPVFDTTKIHVEKSLEYIFGN